MGIGRAAITFAAATLAIAPPAGAAVLDAAVVDTAPAAVVDIAVAPDGTGALVYLKASGGDDRVWASILADGAWSALVRIDPDDGDDESAPRVAAGNGGRVLVGYADDAGRTLKYRIKSSTGSGFAPERPMRTAANAIQSDWDLDMNASGVAYAAWIEPNPGTMRRDARAWRSDGATDLVSLRLQKDPNAEGANASSNGPDVRVAVDDAGGGTIVFGQSEGGGESTYLRRLTGVTPGSAFVDVEVPSVLGESLSSGTVQLDLDVAGTGLAWFAAAAMYTAGGHAIGVPVTGEIAGTPALLDPYPASENDNVERPDVALNASGQGLFASEPNLRAGVFGGSIAGTSASPAQRLDTSPHDPDSEVPVAAIGDGGRGLIAWTRDVGDGADGPFQVVGRAWDGGAFGPETLLVDTAKTPFAASSADGAGASRLGDVAVLTERDVGGTRSVVVGRWDAPPSAPTILSAPGGTFAWAPAEAIWSPLTSYEVVIDDAVAATLGTDARSYVPVGLRGGTHSWRIVAVDALGQRTSSPVQLVAVDPPAGQPPRQDARSPRISRLSQSRRSWSRNQGTRFALTLSEAATLSVELRELLPGRKVRGRCAKPRRALRRRPRCTRALTRGTLTRRAASGPISIAFDGRIGRRTLRAGRYEAVFRASDAAGNVSAPQQLRFRILRR